MSFKKYIFLIGSSQEIPEALGQFIANHLMTLQTRFFLFLFLFPLTLLPFCLLSCPPPVMTLIFCPHPRLFNLFSILSFLSLLKSGCKLQRSSKEKRETQDLTGNMFGICKGFFPPMETVFYLNKREHVLFSSESVFEKFYVMFPWLSGKCFGAKIICAIEQAGKKIPKRANIFTLSPCLQREGQFSLRQPPFYISTGGAGALPWAGTLVEVGQPLANC